MTDELDRMKREGAFPYKSEKEAKVRAYSIALQELDILIEETENETPDPLTSDVFEARDWFKQQLESME